MNNWSVGETSVTCHLRDLVLNKITHAQKYEYKYAQSVFFFGGNIKSKKDPIQLEFATCGLWF